MAAGGNSRVVASLGISSGQRANGRPSGGTTVPRATIFESVAFFSVCVLIFVLFSRVVEYPGLSSLHLAVGAFAVAMVFLPISGGIGRVLGDPLCWGMFGLTFLMLVATAFGIFRGGSIETLQLYWSRSLILFVAIGATVSTFTQFRQLILTFAFAVIALSVYSLKSGVDQQGRIGMSSGFFSNPNDLAAILVLALPLIWLAVRSLKWPLVKCIVLAMTTFIWATFLRTGSRGGFVSLSFILFLLFFHGSFVRKIQMVIAGLSLLVVAVMVLPSSTLKRFVVFSENVRLAEFQEGEEDAYTAASSESRLEMARQGVMFTFDNPILGLGPGNFRVASSAYFKQRGIHAPWTDVHNTYLQISSENGTVALIIYFGLLIIAARRLTTIYRRYRHALGDHDKMLSESAWYVRLALFGYIVSAMFGNYAYQYHLPLLLGLTIGLCAAERSRLVVPPITGSPAGYRGSSTARHRLPAV